MINTPSSIRYGFLFLNLLLVSNSDAAQSGPLATVRGTGTSATLDVNVWLNGDGPLSGQSYHVTGGATLSVAPTIPNKTYAAMGIEVSTPGLTISSGCNRYVGNRCIFSARSDAPATLTVSNPGHPIIFVTDGTEGNFSTGPTDNGDAYCATQARLNNPLFYPNNYTYRAVTITSNQYPCNYVNNQAGCMTSGGHTYNTPNWPLVPGTTFYEPDGTTPYASVSTNGIFDGNTAGSLRYTNGNVATSNLWVGIQELGINSQTSPTTITAWGYNDLNPGTINANNDGNPYTAYGPNGFGGTCGDWTDPTKDGTIGLANHPLTFPSGDGAYNATYGNYFAWTNGTGTFTRPSYEWSQSSFHSCNNTFAVVCIGLPI
jgi:hypothetical protein